jgi:hypothetical protein
MRISTLIILALGCVTVAWGAFWWVWDLITRPASWDIEIPLTVVCVGIGLCIVGVSVLKWLLFDWRLWVNASISI